MIKYNDWICYFEQNRWPDLPASPRLAPDERELIAKSLAQFQLGEGTTGRTFLRLGRGIGDADYARSLELFIAEEHRHSEMLGRFMDAEGIVRRMKDPADGVFHFIRGLWNLEVMVTVLVSAECVAVPYYSALHNATKSPHLRALCRHILRDEAMHLKYQGQTLAMLATGRGFWTSSLTRTLHRFMVLAATLIVYSQHREFCRGAGWALEDFVGASFQALAQVEKRLPGCAVVGFGWSNDRPPGRSNRLHSIGGA